jgi:hypothetical protein
MPVSRRERLRIQQKRFPWSCSQFPGGFDYNSKSVRSSLETSYEEHLPDGAKFAKQVKELFRCYVVAVRESQHSIFAVFV